MDSASESFDLVGAPEHSPRTQGAASSIKIESFDLQAFLGRFRVLLQAENPATEIRLKEEIAKYDQLCEYANERLRECFFLSKRGFHANAVAISEQPPNLLEWSVQLDIPESSILAMVAEVLEVTPPTLLNRELFQALQDAYDKNNAVAANLKSLHRLTLARAPLPTRLSVMRLLNVQDPNSPFLDGDIRTFEKAWFKQASDFVKPFVKEGRPELVEEVLQDLLEGGYLETAPGALLTDLQAQLGKAQATQLPAVAAEIRQAYAERSISTLMRLAERFREFADGAGIGNAAVKFEVVEPLQWLASTQAEDRMAQDRREASARLSEMLRSDDYKRVDLEIAYRTAMDLGAVDGTLERAFRAKLADQNRRRIAIMAGASAAVLIVVAGMVVTVGWAIQSASTEQSRRQAFEHAVRELERARADADIAQKVEKARKLAANDEDRQQIDALEKDWSDRRASLVASEKQQLDDNTRALRAACERLLADARGFRFGGPQKKEFEDLHDQAMELRRLVERSGAGLHDLKAAEQALGQIEAWKALADEFTALKTEMEGEMASKKTLERLAAFLNDKVATNSADVDATGRAKLARDSLPTWIKTLEVQDELRTGRFVSRPVRFDDWQGQPPSAPLTAAADYSTLLQNRDFKARDSTASKLKERLGAIDVAPVWVIRRRGQENRYYTRQEPPGGEEKCLVNVLLNSLGQEEKTPFVGPRDVKMSPQTIFARHAARLWELPDPNGWHENIAEVYDALLDAKDMEPLLKLDLARKFLDLAVSTSFGYRKALSEHDGFKEVTGMMALIEGNWLDPARPLDPQRQRAEALLAQAPRLGPISREAGRLDEVRLTALKQGLVVAGWVCRDGESGLKLARFDRANPGVGHLYTFVKGKWINLGAVVSDGTDARLSDAAEKFVGWPAFAIKMDK